MVVEVLRLHPLSPPSPPDVVPRRLGLPPSPSHGELGVPRQPLPRHHLADAQLDHDVAHVRGVLSGGEAEGVASLLAVSRRHGHAAGERIPSAGDRLRLASQDALPRQARRHLLARGRRRAVVYGGGMHEGCARRQVRRRSLSLRCCIYSFRPKFVLGKKNHCLLYTFITRD